MRIIAFARMHVKGIQQVGSDGDGTVSQAAANNTVGGSFDDLAAIIERVEDKARIGICFDTCHAFAAGYDLRSPEAYEATMKELDKVVGLKFVKAFHLNDSVKGLGCHRDLHANIGKHF